MHSSFATTEQQIRLSWKVGSFCLIYSRSDNKWHNGQIQSITISTSDMKEEKEFDSKHEKHKNEWLIVKYNNNKKTKRIQRLCKDIKPIENNYNILLKKHSYCLIYSTVLDIWCKGQVIKIFKDSEGEWLRVKYWDTNEHKICEIQRFSKDLKIYSQIHSKVFSQQEPGATNPPNNNNNIQDDKNKQIEEMKKLLAQKDAKIAAMKAKASQQNSNKITTNNNNNNNNESKSPPKTDVTLSLRGIPEYDSYPHSMSSNKFYFMASVKAPYFRSEERAPIDLVAVVDESGSMDGDRIKLVKETVQFIIKNLESNDRFGIVGYSSGSRIVLPLTKMDTNGKVTAQRLANGLRASGGTALCAGLVMGVNMMRNRTYKNDVASVMILTDGQANEGPTSAQQINAAVLSGKVSGAQGQIQGQNDMLSEEKEGIKSAKLSNELPCTINTFGFGSGHNESLLESIAENGRGMYAFIENTDMIADTFAECLGGLVSIIGQNIRIRVEALNNILINKCLSDGYTITILSKNKIYQVSINNLQSEENRDLIFELSVPKLNNNGNAKDNDPIIQLSVQYKNVVKDKQEILSNVCTINRIDGKQIGERNIELDVQYNRILAANAMEQADEMANKGQLDEARKILTNAQKHIKRSKSNKNKFSQALIGDIQTIQNNMKSRQQYRLTGSKSLKMNISSHKRQRSVQSSVYASQSEYCTSSKSVWRTKSENFIWQTKVKSSK